MSYEEKTIDSRIVYEGPVFRIRKYKVDTVGGEAYRDVLEHRGGAVILPVTSEGKILMERQYRKPLEREVFELPAGKIDPNEVPEVTAARELEEETGYIADTVEHMLTYYPTCGYSNEALHIFFAKGLRKGTVNLDPTECLDVEEWDPDSLIEMIMTNEIMDSKTIIGLLYARQKGLI